MSQQKHQRPRRPQRPYFIVRRLQFVQDLETVLNELRDEGYVIKWVMGGPDTFTVVALMPEG